MHAPRQLPELRLTVYSDGTIIGPSGRALRPFRDKNGYLRINTYSAGKWRQHAVHVLVCEAFHGPRPEGLLATHRNGVKSDCRAVNLAWRTRRENEADKVWHGTARRGESHSMAKLDAVDVRAIRGSHESSAELAFIFGVSPSTIRNVRNRTTWGHVA